MQSCTDIGMGHIGMRSDLLEQILMDDLVDGYGDTNNFVNCILSITTEDRHFSRLTGQCDRTVMLKSHTRSRMTFDHKSCYDNA